jgi:preprotein translocase subunit SecE
MGKAIKAANVKTASANWSKVLWSLIVLLFAAALYSNYVYFQEVSIYFRIAGWIVLFAVLLGLAGQTSNGKAAFGFMKSARMELRKVSWPTRHETVQTTFIIVLMIIVVALLLWGIDTFFMWAVSWITGQRG